MKQPLYHTIDPLILQTLNLNQKRMNHILDILHGRPQRKQIKNQKKRLNFSLPYTIKHVSNNDQSLPIIHTQRKQQSQTQKLKFPMTSRQIEPKKSIIQISRANSPTSSITSHHNQVKYRIIPKQTKQSTKNNIQSSRDLNMQDKIKIKQQLQHSQHNKKVQLLQDYMLRKLRKSKSQQINPKDIYRAQIEALVATPVSIDQIEQIERKMKRLKKRHNHLLNFDKQYFTKLNQHDIFMLS